MVWAVRQSLVLHYASDQVMGQSRAEVKTLLKAWKVAQPVRRQWDNIAGLQHREVLSLEDSHLLSLLCLSEM